MKITAKFASECRACGRRVEVGTTVEWARGRGVSHLDCQRDADFDARVDRMEEMAADTSPERWAEIARQENDMEFQAEMAAERALACDPLPLARNQLHLTAKVGTFMVGGLVRYQQGRVNSVRKVSEITTHGTTEVAYLVCATDEETAMFVLGEQERAAKAARARYEALRKGSN